MMFSDVSGVRDNSEFYVGTVQPLRLPVRQQSKQTVKYSLLLMKLYCACPLRLSCSKFE